jgi:hypothetical protein
MPKHIPYEIAEDIGPNPIFNRSIFTENVLQKSWMANNNTNLKGI